MFTVMFIELFRSELISHQLLISHVAGNGQKPHVDVSDVDVIFDLLDS